MARNFTGERKKSGMDVAGIRPEIFGIEIEYVSKRFCEIHGRIYFEGVQMIREVTTYILDEIGMGYWDRDITFFVGHIPLKNKDGEDVASMVRFAVLLETSPGATIPDLKDRVDQTFQILNYNRSYFRARDDAWAFYELLHSSSQCDLPIVGSGIELSAYIINAIGSPAPIENPDDKGRFVFSTNYLWMIGYR